jgi:hypothetical protein
MANIKKTLEGILKSGRKKAPKKKQKKQPVKILALQKQADVSKVLKIARVTPMILLYIKEYRSKNKSSLKKALQKLKDGGEEDGIQSKLLDQNWVVVMAPNTSLVR